MTQFEQALIDRLKKLEDDYMQHRNALLDALAFETGKEIAKHEVAPDGDALSPRSSGFHTTAAHSGPPPHPGKITGMTDGEVESQKDIVQGMISALVLAGKKEFTKEDVFNALSAPAMVGRVNEYTLKNLSSFLWRLHKNDKFIEIKHRGEGQRPNVYVVAKRE